MNKQQPRSPAGADNHALLLEMANTRMPFGKYTGTRLIDLPEYYVVWFSRNGYPKGKLGYMLEALYEIKLNGLEYLFKELKRDDRKEGKK